MTISEFIFDEELSTLTLNECKQVKNTCNKFASIKQPVLMSNIARTINVVNKKYNKLYFTNSFYNNNKRVVFFDNVTCIFDQQKYKNVFGPNIDTILFCNGLKKLMKKTNQINNFLEIGVGSGFIAKYIATKQPLSKGTLIDIEPDSIKYVINDLKLPNIKNIKKNKSQYGVFYTNSRYEIIQGDALYYIETKINTKTNEYLHDLVICNPPYIPRNIEKKHIDPNNKEIAKNFFEGTYLMRYMLTHIRKLTSSNMVMLISSMSFCIKHLETLLNDISNIATIKILDSREVPVKVYYEKNNKTMFLHEDKQWVNFLSKSSGKYIIQNNSFIKGIIKKKENIYPIWHVIYVVCFQLNN